MLVTKFARKIKPGVSIHSFKWQSWLLRVFDWCDSRFIVEGRSF